MTEMNYDNCMMQDDKTYNSQSWHDRGWERALNGLPAIWRNPDYVRGYEAGTAWLFELKLRMLSELR